MGGSSTHTMYNLKKWYFDFLTPQNDYVFIYFAAIRLAGAAMRSVTVHLARPEKRTLLTRCMGLPRWEPSAAETEMLRLPGGEVRWNETECALEFSDAQCAVQLKYELTPRAELRPVVIPTGRRSLIRWRPVSLGVKVRGFVTVGGERVEAEAAHGYIDYLESSCLPPLVPVRKLVWGRLARTGLELVYMHAAEAKDRRAWSAFYGRAGETSFNCDQVSVKADGPAQHRDSLLPADNGYLIVATNGKGSARVMVRPEAVVQQGSFIDQQEHTSPLGRWLLKMLTRNPRGAKFLSRADVRLNISGMVREAQELPMISEYVLL